MSKINIESLFSSLRILFQLQNETDKLRTREQIYEGVVFAGYNVWMLIIAIIIASIGLNLNSSAVIIGAMLISPLMGPIAGVGFALSVYDVALLRKSLWNLMLMTGISLIVSFIYFSLSPMDQPTSEILARTTPTFFDVLIAIAGGSALIIGISRKKISTNTLAGVAIATALMPPICTAGYGLSVGNWSIFFGAMYLYLINSVFIGFIVFIFSKYLRFSSINESGAEKEIKKRHVTLTIVALVAFITPSIFGAYDIIKETSYQRSVDNFVSESFNFPESPVLKVNKLNGQQGREIEVILLGRPINREVIGYIEKKLASSPLADTKLRVIQNGDSKTELADSQKIAETSGEIEELKKKIKSLTDSNEILNRVQKELLLIFPEIEAISYGDLLIQDFNALEPQQSYNIFVRWKNKTPKGTKVKFQTYIRLRLGSIDVRVNDL